MFVVCFFCLCKMPGQPRKKKSSPASVSASPPSSPEGAARARRGQVASDYFEAPIENACGHPIAAAALRRHLANPLEVTYCGEREAALPSDSSPGGRAGGLSQLSPRYPQFSLLEVPAVVAVLESISRRIGPDTGFTLAQARVVRDAVARCVAVGDNAVAEMQGWMGGVEYWYVKHVRELTHRLDGVPVYVAKMQNIKELLEEELERVSEEAEFCDFMREVSCTVLCDVVYAEADEIHEPLEHAELVKKLGRDYLRSRSTACSLLHREFEHVRSCARKYAESAEKYYRRCLQFREENLRLKEAALKTKFAAEKGHDDCIDTMQSKIDELETELAAARAQVAALAPLEAVNKDLRVQVTNLQLRAAKGGKAKKSREAAREGGFGVCFGRYIKKTHNSRTNAAELAPEFRRRSFLSPRHQLQQRDGGFCPRRADGGPSCRWRAIRCAPCRWATNAAAENVEAGQIRPGQTRSCGKCVPYVAASQVASPTGSVRRAVHARSMSFPLVSDWQAAGRHLLSGISRFAPRTKKQTATFGGAFFCFCCSRGTLRIYSRCCAWRVCACVLFLFLFLFLLFKNRTAGGGWNILLRVLLLRLEGVFCVFVFVSTL